MADLINSSTAVPGPVPNVDAHQTPDGKKVGQIRGFPIEGIMLVGVPAGEFEMGSNDGDADTKSKDDWHIIA